MLEGVVSTADLAVELDVTPETVVRWIREGQLRGFRRGGRWQIPVEDAEAFAEDYGLARGESHGE